MIRNNKSNGITVAHGKVYFRKKKNGEPHRSVERLRTHLIVTVVVRFFNLYSSFGENYWINQYIQKLTKLLSFENKIDCQYQEYKPNKVIYLELGLKSNVREDGEHHQRDYFLQHFELNQRKGSSVGFKAYSVGRHLKTVFKKGDCPTKHNHAKEWEFGKSRLLRQFEVSIPRKGHKDIGAKK